MRFFKTLRTQRPSYSEADRTVYLSAPRSWRELTQEQLRYVLWLLATFTDHTVVRTYMFCRFTGVHIAARDRFGWKCFVRTAWWGRRRFFTMQAWQVEHLIGQFRYIDTYEDMDVRLEEIRGLHAVDILLHGVAFYDYLNAEKYYQAYMLHNDDRFLNKLALQLYRRHYPRWLHKLKYFRNREGSIARHVRLDRAESLGVVLWFSYVKSEMARAFPHFFKRLGPESAGGFDMMEAMNAQIRALTDGDVTKEDIVLHHTDCWRALTELDQKAREAEEFKKSMKK